MIHNITIRVFARATEDESRVKNALSFFLVDDIEIERAVTEGHYGNPIIIMEAKFQGRTCKRLMDHIKSVMDEKDIARVISELEDRIDEDCYLHLKFDKQAALNGKAALTAGDPDGIAVRAKLKAFPAKHDIAVKIAGMLFYQN